MSNKLPVKNKLAVEELRERGFRWDGGQWISTKSGFFYGRGNNAYDSAVSTLESVGFQWSTQDQAWLEPVVLGDDFKFSDDKIELYDFFMVGLVVAVFGVIGFMSGLL